jgi:hypothetical protein
MRPATPASVVLVAGALATVAGCGGRTAPARPAVQAEIRTLHWDLDGVGDDLLVARLDVAEQYRRVRQADADLRAARAASAGSGCSAAARVVASDVHGAANGIVALQNDTSRAEVSLSYVERDLTQLRRAEAYPGLDAGTRKRLRIAADEAVTTVRRIREFLAAAAATVHRLEERVAARARTAGGLCAKRSATAHSKAAVRE